MLPAAEYDYDYVSWNDREITVRVPDGASSGNIRVMTDKGLSNAVYFEVKDLVGNKLFSDRRILHVQRSLEIQDVQADPGNGLYLWFPRIWPAPEQREIELVSVEPEPMFDDYKGSMLFFFEDLKPGDRKTVNVDFIFSRYAVETNVNASRVRHAYDESQKLFQVYTSPNSLVPSANETLRSVAGNVVGRERNPYGKAWLLYSYTLDRLAYSANPGGIGVVEALNTRTGNAYHYSLLFCSLARAAGLPARPVAGYLVTGRGACIRHTWAEFYLEKVGWIPVDPLLGDGVKFGDLGVQAGARNAYFGGLDNRHMTLSKGLVSLEKMNPNGRQVTRREAAGFQSVQEESVGNLYSYSSRWGELKLLGMY